MSAVTSLFPSLTEQVLNVLGVGRLCAIFLQPRQNCRRKCGLRHPTRQRGAVGRGGQTVLRLNPVRHNSCAQPSVLTAAWSDLRAQSF